MPEPESQDLLKHRSYEDVLGIFSGTVMAAAGLTILQHLGLVTGQIAGLALLVSHWTGISVGTAFFCLNLPFYWLAFRRMGPAFTLKTFSAVALLAALIWAQPWLLVFEHINPLAGALLAGILSGAGLLALFRHRASLGGIGILAIYLQEKSGFRAGWLQMAVDGVIFTLAAFTLPFDALLLSLTGAVMLNVVILVNHRSDRYLGM